MNGSIPFPIPESPPSVTTRIAEDNLPLGTAANAAARAAQWEAQEGLHGIPDKTSSGGRGEHRTARLAVRRHILAALGYAVLAEETGADLRLLLATWDAIRVAAAEAARPSGDLPCCTLLACCGSLARARVASLKEGLPSTARMLSCG